MNKVNVCFIIVFPSSHVLEDDRYYLSYRQSLDFFTNNKKYCKVWAIVNHHIFFVGDIKSKNEFMLKTDTKEFRRRVALSEKKLETVVL